MLREFISETFSKNFPNRPEKLKGSEALWQSVNANNRPTFDVKSNLGAVSYQESKLNASSNSMLLFVKPQLPALFQLQPELAAVRSPRLSLRSQRNASAAQSQPGARCRSVNPSVVEAGK